MPSKVIPIARFNIGDLVYLCGKPISEHYCIIGFSTNDSNQRVAILKAIFNDIDIIERPLSELKSLLIRGEL